MIHRERQGIMLCYPFSESRLLKWPKPFIVQPKLDGIRCLWNYQQGLISSTGLHITSVPHIERFLMDLGDLSITLDGELYIPQANFQYISSVINRSVTLHPDYEEVQFYIFDIKSNEPQFERIALLNKIGKEINKTIKLVESVECFTLEELSIYLSNYISIGYEGIICRNYHALYKPKRSTDIMKFKPRRSDTYKIIGVTEEISINGELKNTLGAFICEKDGQQFKVGSGPLLTQEARKYLWNNLNIVIGGYLEIKYQELTNRKVPRFPIAGGISYANQQPT